MVGVQNEDAVHRAGEDSVGLVLLARHRKAHAQEIRRVIEIILRIDEGLTDGIFVGHGGDRRHLRDHADRGDHPLGRIGDVGGVVIERRKRADTARHHRHRVRVTPKTLIKPTHLLVHHGVVRDAVVEVGFLRGGGKLSVKQKIGDFKKEAKN